MRPMLALILAFVFFGLMVSFSIDEGLRQDVRMIEKNVERIARDANVPAPVAHARAKYPWKPATATVFWVGEESGPENAYIANAMSAFDMKWLEHYGGVDDPDKRCGFRPCAFTPKENPFYIALPYSDFEDDGTRRSNAPLIPWYSSTTTKSHIKNRWVEIQVGGKSCFGQWEDVGPLEENDVAYVFGSSTQPLNTFSTKAGIDLSPAVRDCLSLGDVSTVQWRHVDDSDVPSGPWKEIVTK